MSGLVQIATVAGTRRAMSSPKIVRSSGLLLEVLRPYAVADVAQMVDDQFRIELAHQELIGKPVRLHIPPIQVDAPIPVTKHGTRPEPAAARQVAHDRRPEALGCHLGGDTEGVLRGKLTLQAATTLDFAADEIAAQDGRFSTAVALATPKRVGAAPTSVGEHDQPTEALTDAVDTATWSRDGGY